MMAGMLRALAGGAWLDRARVRRWAGLCLLVQLVVACVMIAGTHGWLMKLPRPTTTDFVSFYAAGTLAAEADPARVYDRPTHYAAEQAATSPGIGYVYFFYPPVYLLYCRALALLPYLPAFILFQLLGAGLCAVVLRRIDGSEGKLWVLPVVSFSPVVWNVCIGQNALLTAGLFGAGTWLLHRRRHFVAGVVLGLLFYKPHTGLLLPLVLLAAGNWRAIAGAGLSVCSSILLSVALFGTRAWRVFVSAILASHTEYADGSIVPYTNTVSMFGALREMGIGVHAASVIHGGVAAAVALLVAWCWRTSTLRRTCAADYAMLISAALLAMPVVLFYDLTALIVAGAWIVRDARRTGFLSGEKSTLAAVWLGGLLCYPLAHAARLPIGVGCVIAVFATALRRRHWAGYPTVNPTPITMCPASSANARMQPVGP